MLLSLKNLTNENYTAEIADTTYKRGTRKIVLEKNAEILQTFALSASYNWYDLIIKIKGNDLFKKDMQAGWKLALMAKPIP